MGREASVEAVADSVVECIGNRVSGVEMRY
jgi:hypothetical protein